MLMWLMPRFKAEHAGGRVCFSVCFASPLHVFLFWIGFTVLSYRSKPATTKQNNDYDQQAGSKAQVQAMPVQQARVIWREDGELASVPSVPMLNQKKVACRKRKRSSRSHRKKYRGCARDAQIAHRGAEELDSLDCSQDDTSLPMTALKSPVKKRTKTRPKVHECVRRVREVSNEVCEGMDSYPFDQLQDFYQFLQLQLKSEALECIGKELVLSDSGAQS